MAIIDTKQLRGDGTDLDLSGRADRAADEAAIRGSVLPARSVSLGTITEMVARSGYTCTLGEYRRMNGAA
jgi:hypothetical protein